MAPEARKQLLCFGGVGGFLPQCLRAMLFGTERGRELSCSSLADLRGTRPMGRLGCSHTFLAIAVGVMCFGTKTSTGVMQQGAPRSTVWHELVPCFRQEGD